MDEVAGFHETLNAMLDFSWAIPGGIVAACFGVAYLRFLGHLPARTQWLFVAAGCVFVAGAVGVEMATDWYDERDLLDTLAYNLWDAVEEGLEMGGVVLFTHALLGYMGARTISASTCALNVRNNDKCVILITCRRRRLVLGCGQYRFHGTPP